MIKKIDIELKSGFKLSMTIEEAEELRVDLDKVLDPKISAVSTWTWTEPVKNKLETT